MANAIKNVKEQTNNDSKFEIKSFPFECKVDMDNDVFEGYFSITGNVDDGDDRMMPGAFTKTFKENIKRIKGLYMHEIKKPFSRPLELYEDSKGAFVKGTISKCSWGQELKILMYENIVTEMSLGYDAIKYDFTTENGRQIRNLREIKCWEYSPVLWGMNSQTSINMVKSLSKFENLLDEIKAGRAISAMNKDAIQQAINALMALLDENEPQEPEEENPEMEMETDGCTQEPMKSQTIDFDPDYLQSILCEAQKYI
jgi:HK97 family phage prohead protease